MESGGEAAQDLQAFVVAARHDVVQLRLGLSLKDDVTFHMDPDRGRVKPRRQFDGGDLGA